MLKTVYRIINNQSSPWYKVYTAALERSIATHQMYEQTVLDSVESNVASLCSKHPGI
jgi:hypothetical protein